MIDSTFDSGEFEQLLLTCIEGCGLQSNRSRFKVRANGVTDPVEVSVK